MVSNSGAYDADEHAHPGQRDAKPSNRSCTHPFTSATLSLSDSDGLSVVGDAMAAIRRRDVK